MAEITDTTLNEIEAEYMRWSEFLNVGIGLLSFSLAISCLGTPAPKNAALISLIFMLLFMIYGQKHFPRKLRELRKISLKGVDEVALLGIERKYFGLDALLRNFPVFLFGWLFLGAVSIFGVALI